MQESPAKRKPEMPIAFRWQTALDAVSAALLASAAVWYFATPEIVERPLRPLAYDRDGNVYASLQCKWSEIRRIYSPARGWNPS